jgi:cellulose synthase/poly-beta-1,6-N-acetylglucosamine synthase-like glycosyltransferase
MFAASPARLSTGPSDDARTAAHGPGGCPAATAAAAMSDTDSTPPQVPFAYTRLAGAAEPFAPSPPRPHGVRGVLIRSLPRFVPAVVAALVGLLLVPSSVWSAFPQADLARALTIGLATCVPLAWAMRRTKDDLRSTREPLVYRVRYRRPRTSGRFWKYIFSAIIASTAVIFFGWMFLTAAHYPDLHKPVGEAVSLVVMFGAIAVIELFRCFNMIAIGASSSLIRDPIPCDPLPGKRVAFITTIVPGKEPVEMAERTLTAALRLRSPSPIDVWLLDEGDDDEVKAMCRRIGVNHFSRSGVLDYNVPWGRYKYKSKHGNHNAWLDRHGSDYDYLISVDTDHVPHPDMALRMLPYLADRDVAFVVGPQVYGNYDNVATKGAESMQFVFHSLIQRMGNFFGCAMFVGTNNAVRISALREIGGFKDSITEDMATSMVFHSSRNPVSGRRWKSVYTPDVLAVGEGPSSFTDLFSQQHRWSRGLFEILTTLYWRKFWKLPLGGKLQYTLLAAYYPTVAISWILGALNYTLYLLVGTVAVNISANWWVALYTDMALVLIYVYAINRKHNVSPHEPKGALGFGGMFFSVLCFPIYVLALVQTAMRRTSGFVVTPKGSSQSPDGWVTFRQQLGWGCLFIGVAVTSVALGRFQLHMLPWVIGLSAVCMGGPVIWRCQVHRAARATRRTIPRSSARHARPVVDKPEIEAA